MNNGYRYADAKLIELSKHKISNQLTNQNRL